MSYYKTMHLLVSEDDTGLILIRNFHNILFPETTLNSVKSTKNALEFLRETSVDPPKVYIPKKWIVEETSYYSGMTTSHSNDDQYLYVNKKEMCRDPHNASDSKDNGTKNSMGVKAPGGFRVAAVTLKQLQQRRN